MKSKQQSLAATLGPEKASSFGGGAAGANVGLVQSLPDNQKFAARQAFSSSLSTMWIMYVAFAVVGLAVSFLIGKNTLDKQHEETKTGLDVEKQKKLERDAERVERRRKRASKGSLPLDAEAQADEVPAAPATGESKDTKA
jgi:hypothetical protein